MWHGTWKCDFNLHILLKNGQVKYKKWIWWTRVAMLITVLQFTSAIFLMVQMFDYVSPNDEASDCIFGK